jgi:uncharacterized protein YndB with AHSA1/START domain
MAGIVATAEVVINAPTDRVWTALTNPDDVKQYMFGTTMESDWQVGSSITWKGEWQGKPYEDKGQILRFEPGQAVAYSHYSPLSGAPDVSQSYHNVTVELSSDGGGTRVTLTQDNNASEEEREHSEANWNMMLEGLRKHVEGGQWRLSEGRDPPR